MTLLIILLSSLLLPAAPAVPAALQRPATTTPLTPEAVADALEAGHVEVFGAKPPRRRLVMAAAQVFAEVGRGRKAVNYNLGNVGAGRDEPYHRIGGARFRAYDSAKEGAVGYWTILRARCSGALRGFDDGDPAEAARRLRRCGYYRDTEEHYRSLLRGLLGAAGRAVAALG